MPTPCFSRPDEARAALACDGTSNATTASTTSAPSAVIGVLLFSNPDGSVVILISLQKRQDAAPGEVRQANGEPRRGFSQAAAEEMRSQPAQASPASTGNDGAVGGTREEDQPPGSRRPHPNRPRRPNPHRRRPPRHDREGRTAWAPGARGDRPSSPPNAPDRLERSRPT